MHSWCLNLSTQPHLWLLWLACGLAPPAGDLGELRLWALTIDHNGEQAVTEGVQPLVTTGDDLVEYLCREGGGWRE